MVRQLTVDEIGLAKSVFGDRSDYSKFRIHHGSDLPFGLQEDKVAMTPNGELYFRYWYRDDFSVATDDVQHLFIHEMAHGWQRGKGMNVIVRGLVSWIVSYSYSLDNRLLSEYPMEQQAQIIADNFTLQAHGFQVWSRFRRGDNPIVTLEDNAPEAIIRQKHKHTLRGFPW